MQSGIGVRYNSSQLAQGIGVTKALGGGYHIKVRAVRVGNCFHNTLSMQEVNQLLVKNNDKA